MHGLFAGLALIYAWRLLLRQTLKSVSAGSQISLSFLFTTASRVSVMPLKDKKSSENPDFLQ